MTSGKAIRITSCSLGALMALVATVSALRNGLGRLEILTIAFGFATVMLALLGPSGGRAYRGAAVILLNTIVTFVVLELGSAAVLMVIFQESGHSSAPEPTGPPRGAPQSSYYVDQPWGARYLQELTEVWFSYRYFPHELFRRAPYTGELINISREGLRVTPGSVCEPGIPRVYVFGGSTVWGYGVPDWGTIPAYLQAGWSRSGHQVCVINFGQLGHTSTQGLIALQRELQRCRVPDGVIFYDGVNDVSYGHQANLPGAHSDLQRIARRMEATKEVSSQVKPFAIVRLVHRFIPDKPPTQPRFPGPSGMVSPELAAGIGEVYWNNIRMVRALAREYGFDDAYFWQPNIWVGKKPLTEEERRIAAGEPFQAGVAPREDPLTGLFRDVYATVGRVAQPGTGLYDISSVFDTVPSLVYLDSHHLTHEGNRLVAERMIQVLGTPWPPRTSQSSQRKPLTGESCPA